MNIYNKLLENDDKTNKVYTIISMDIPVSLWVYLLHGKSLVVRNRDAINLTIHYCYTLQEFNFVLVY